MRATSLLEVIERTRRTGSWRHHLDEFLDAFYGHDGDVVAQTDAIRTDPGLLADARADAYVGGTAEHLARRWGLSIPGWVRGQARYLGEAMFEADERRIRPLLIAASPVAFRTRLIFTGPDPLQRARFPYRRGVQRLPAEVSRALLCGANHRPDRGE